MVSAFFNCICASDDHYRLSALASLEHSSMLHVAMCYLLELANVATCMCCVFLLGMYGCFLHTKNTPFHDLISRWQLVNITIIDS